MDGGGCLTFWPNMGPLEREGPEGGARERRASGVSCHARAHQWPKRTREVAFAHPTDDMGTKGGFGGKIAMGGSKARFEQVENRLQFLKVTGGAQAAVHIPFLADTVLQSTTLPKRKLTQGEGHKTKRPKTPQSITKRHPVSEKFSQGWIPALRSLLWLPQ